MVLHKHTMPKDPSEQLPARELIEFSASHRAPLCDIVLPSRRLAAYELGTQQEEIHSFAAFIRQQGLGAQRYAQSAATSASGVAPFTTDTAWPSRLVHGDNLLAMAALLAGDAYTPSLRACVHLIYADVPYADAAHCRSRLAARLILMRELLAQTGCMMIHLHPSLVRSVMPMLEHVLGVSHMVVSEQGLAHGVMVRYCKSITQAAQLREQSCQALLHDPPSKMAHTMAHMVQQMCPTDGWVADFYARTGMTAVVAEKLGRRWIGVDRDALVCQQIRRRLNAHKAQPFLFQVIFG